jgi:hypothetical protein
MTRILESRWFPLWAAACCAVCVAFATWVSVDASTAGRVGAGVAGLGVGVVLMFAIPFLLAGLMQPQPDRPRPSVTHAAPSAPAAEPAPGAVSVADDAGVPVAVPEPAAARSELAGRLDAGRALRDAAAADAIDAWVADARRAVEQCAPGAAGYFAALDARPWDDAGRRLDAHLARLETILRDFL